MAEIKHTIAVRNEFESQTFVVTGSTSASGVVSEADADAAAQAFAAALVSGTDSPYPLEIVRVQKTTTTVTDVVL